MFFYNLQPHKHIELNKICATTLYVCGDRWGHADRISVKPAQDKHTNILNPPTQPPTPLKCKDTEMDKGRITVILIDGGCLGEIIRVEWNTFESDWIEWDTHSFCSYCWLFIHFWPFKKTFIQPYLICCLSEAIVLPSCCTVSHCYCYNTSFCTKIGSVPRYWNYHKAMKQLMIFDRWMF